VSAVFPKNKVEYIWKKDKDGSIKELEQKIEVKKDFNIHAKYNKKKDETKISIENKDHHKNIKETKQGMVIIKLTTKKGKLEFEY